MGLPSQRPVTRSFDVFFGQRLRKRLNKQSKRRWFETSSRSLWRHCSVFVETIASPFWKKLESVCEGVMLRSITDVIRQGFILFIVKCFYPNDYVHSSLFIILWYRPISYIFFGVTSLRDYDGVYEATRNSLDKIDMNELRTIYSHNKTKHNKTVRMHYGIHWVSVPLTVIHE